MMAPMLEAFREIASEISYQAPKLSMISTLTGKELGAGKSMRNTGSHISAPVRYREAVLALKAKGVQGHRSRARQHVAVADQPDPERGMAVAGQSAADAGRMGSDAGQPGGRLSPWRGVGLAGL